MKKTWHIASCSHGKDSKEMVLGLIEKGYPLDEVVFYDTGAEFQAIYKEEQKLRQILRDSGIKYTVLKPERDFFFDMLEKPVCSKKNGEHCGYGWCGGATRWGTTNKIASIDKYSKGIKDNGYEIVHYVGIAYDETNRIAGNIEQGKTLPLVDWKWTEKHCLDYCKSKGCTWEEESGVFLYDILDRVSCWCCSNKNLKELKNIHDFLPEYWAKLLDLQSKIDRPMKEYKNRKYGGYGNLFKMQEIFEAENK